MLRLRIILTIPVYFAFPFGAWSTDSCKVALEGRDNGPVYTANAIHVTGGDIYPLPLVLNRLGMTESTLEAWAGQKVLSVGEGYSDLLPRARALGVDMWAIDPAYPAKGDTLEEYQAKLPNPESTRATDQRNGLINIIRLYGPVLTQGVGEALPFPDASFDRVVSHRLFNNLGWRMSDIIAIVNEALRVARSEVRVEGFLDAWNVDQMVQGTKSELSGWKVEKVRITTLLEGAPFGPVSTTNHLVVFSR